MVKQEPVDETCSNSYNNATPSSSERIRFQGRRNLAFEFREEESPEHRESHPESTSHPESPTRPEANRRSPASSCETESRMFLWPSEEGMKRLRLEAVAKPPPVSSHRSGYFSYLDRRAFDHFQAPPSVNSYLAENIAERQRRVTARMKDDFSPHERQQTFQREKNKGLSLDFGNVSSGRNEANYSTIQEEYRPRSRGQDSSPSGTTEQNGSARKNGSTQPKKKANNTYMNRKDEEPVWKTYQWYRDRKRPHTQQSKRQKSETTIFMQYNEIRDKRFQEGRVVNDKKRLLEPQVLENNNETDPLSSSPYNTANVESSHVVMTQNGGSEHPGSSPTQTLSGVYLTKRRKLSHDSTTPFGENRHFKGDGRADFANKGHTAHHYNSSRAVMQLVHRDDNRNFEKEKVTQRAGYCDGVEPRNGPEAPSNNDEVSTANNDDGLDEISSTTYDDDIDVLPDTFRHCPQDVAKILRLSRIVNAVRNNRKGQLSLGVRKEQQTAEKMKEWEVNSHHRRLQDEEEDGMLSVERREKQMEYPSDSDQDLERGYEEENTEKAEEERNPNENYIRYFRPDGSPNQAKYEQVKRFEVRPDYSDFNLSNLDQEPYFVGQMNAVDDDDTVCQVNGLLSLPGFKETKFNISLGELKRRMNPPETLTRVEMISYLRQAKSSGRVLLDRNNIVTANRSHPTILSRVCESEAQVLADGILKMNREYLPLATLAHKTVETYKDDGCMVDNCEDCRLKLRRRIVDVEITR